MFLSDICCFLSVVTYYKDLKRHMKLSELHQLTDIFISPGDSVISSRLKAEQRGGRCVSLWCCLSHMTLIKINRVPVKSPPAVFSPDAAG